MWEVKFEENLYNEKILVGKLIFDCKFFEYIIQHIFNFRLQTNSHKNLLDIHFLSTTKVTNSDFLIIQIKFY